MEAIRKFPERDAVLQTVDNDYYLFKKDILAGLATYSTDKKIAANLETITAERAKEIVEMNKNGEKPQTLSGKQDQGGTTKSVDLLAGESITRFDKTKKKKKKNKKRPPRQDQKPEKK